MEQLFALMPSDPSLAGCVATHLARRQRWDAPGGAALGIGSFDSGEPLLRKSPLSAVSSDVFEALAGLRADALIAWLDDRRRGFQEEETPPERLRGWLFASVGASLADARREEVASQLPESFAVGRDASAPTLLFREALMQLQRLRRSANSDAQAAALAGQALGHAAALSQNPAGLVMTNGRLLVAAHSGQRLSYLLMEGLADCEICEGRSHNRSAMRDALHRRLRTVVVASDARGEGWRSLPEGHVLILEHDLRLRIDPQQS